MQIDCLSRRWLACFLLIGSLSPAWAQEADGISRYMEAAREHAGSEWRAAADFLCAEEPVVGTPAESMVIEPTRLFDNLYVIGRAGTVVYALTTSEGIVLIDAGYEGQEESVLLPGLESLGLSPDDVEYVIVAHGHRDHYGGARYLQENHGAQIIMSQADWDLVEAAEPVDEAKPPPARDLVAADGVLITLGDANIIPILVPGHTPGALALVFSVIDGEANNVAALFGGTVLIASRMDTEQLHQYVDSIVRFAGFTEALGVDVEIQNHPIFDNFPEKVAALGERKPGAGHPFVVGNDAYQGFLNVIADCTRVELARRGAIQ